MSPIIGGRALKGPADRMLVVARATRRSALGVARLYADLVDMFVARRGGRGARARGRGSSASGAVVADTIMTDDASRARVASVVLQAAGL